MVSEELKYLRQFIKDRSGYVFPDQDDAFLQGQLLPLIREKGIDDLTEFVHALQVGRHGLGAELIQTVVPHTSRFFRDGHPFQALIDVILPELLEASRAKNKKQIRIWSAGCATGQEPYSILMVLEEHSLVFKEFPFHLVATDVSSVAVDQAKKGLYSEEEVHEGLPEKYLKKYFKKFTGDWQIVTPLRSNIKFQTHNLLDSPKALGVFDIIFCRNVLNNFEPLTRRQVLKHLAKVLLPGGYLCLGEEETLLGLSNEFEPTENLRGIYKSLA